MICIDSTKVEHSDFLHPVVNLILDVEPRLLSNPFLNNAGDNYDGKCCCALWMAGCTG